MDTFGGVPWGEAVWWLIFILILLKVKPMIEVLALQKEVEKELREEAETKAKKALKEVTKQIMDAEQIVANLKRKRDDLIASIGDGTF